MSALGETKTIIINEKTIILEPFTQKIKTSYTDYLKDYQVRLLDQNRSKLGDDFIKAKRDLLEEFDNGEFDFYSAKFYQSLKWVKHVAHLIWRCSSVHHPIGETGSIGTVEIEAWIRKDGGKEAGDIIEGFSKNVES